MADDNTCGFLPEENPDTFQYDLSLQGSGAIWIERKKNEEYICFSPRIGKEILRIAPWKNFPRRPRICGDGIFWTEYRNGRGVLCGCSPGKKAGPVEAINGCDCGDFAVLKDRYGIRWFLVETFKGVILLSDNDHMIRLSENFAVNSRLCETPEGIMAVWGDYDHHKYKISSGLMTSKGWTNLGHLPSEPGAWENLPCLAVSGEGDLYVARCREKMIELHGGAANFTTDLVVAIYRNNCWRDVASINIDHALNPWMMAYWGFRRQPRLATGSDGVYLLWEEKVDINSASPSLGRFCVQKITRSGVVGKPVVLLDGVNQVVMRTPAEFPEIFVATKTQPKGFIYRLPYKLHKLNLAGTGRQRPRVLENNTAKPIFKVEEPPVSRPLIISKNLSLFFGDPHLHSNLSYDLDSEPDEMYHFARDIAKLDFVVVTENDATRFSEPLTPGDREYGWRLADMFDSPGGFTAFAGWEYTSHMNSQIAGSCDSHRSVIYCGKPDRVISWFDGEAKNPVDLVKTLRAGKVLAHHHHPFGFDITDDTIEANIEIVSGWWNCMRLPEFVEKLHHLLNRGIRLGFIGASDNHQRNPGLGGALTGVWAKENTRESIFAAMRSRRCFATTGLRPDLRFRIGDIFMGGQGECDGAPVLDLQVKCDVSICSVDIIRNGEIVYHCVPNSKDVALTWEDEKRPVGRNWYYVHVGFATENQDVDWQSALPLPWNVKPAYGVDAWSSPIWLDIK